MSILDYGVMSTVDRSEQIQEIVDWAYGQINKDRSVYPWLIEKIQRRYPEFDGLFSDSDRNEVTEIIYDYYWN